MTVLVTRPAGDSEKTVARLAERGIAAIAAPVMAIRPLPDIALPEKADPATCRALIVTSANAIRTLTGRPELAALTAVPLYAVGDHTAETARQAGFTDVRSAAGDVHDLARLLRAEIRPGEGRLVHLSGREVAGDLAGELAAAGYETERRIVYETVAADALPAAARDALEGAEIAAVLLYSPRSAETFGTLAREAGLGDDLARVAAVVISENVAEKARAFGFGHIFVAERPDESALIAALERFLKQSTR